MSIANKIILHLLIVACSPVFVVVASTRCFSCDLSTSDVSYEDAEKRCNSRGPIDCPNAQYKACMTEAFLTRKESLTPAASSSSSSSSSAPSPSFNVMKKCLVDCPVFVNSTAEHIRCCLDTGCNNLIFIETEDSTARPPPSRNLPPEDGQPRSGGGGQSLPTPENQDPSMMRPNGPGRFPPGPEEPGGKRPQHPGAPGGPGGMRPPPPQSEMGDTSQKSSANANGATGGSNLSSGRGNTGASSGVKSESSPLLVLPSIFHVFLLVGISSLASIIQT